MRYDQQWTNQQQQPQQWPQPQYPQYPQYQPYPPQQYPHPGGFYFPPQPLQPPPPPPPPAQTQQRVINTEEDKQRLFNVCKTGRGNAHLLHEALVYAKPSELKQQGLIQEFLSRCRASLELIYSQIPWATSEAARSQSSSVNAAETTEEQLLAALLGANEELLEAIKMYEDLERAGEELQKHEREIQERKLRALEALAAFQPTKAESAVIKQVFDIGDTTNRGVITSHAAAKIFMGSKLSPKVLAAIWEIANVEESDVLSRECVGAAVRLIGHAQKLGPKGKVDEGLLKSPGPVPIIEGLDVPDRRQSMSGGAGPSYGYLPPLSAQDRNKFTKIFFNCGPKNGILSGDRARELLMRSKLTVDQLAQVWELADKDHRGYLDSTGFIVAMYLIQATMSGQLMSIPNTLPPAVYQAASSKTDVFNPNSNPTSWIEGGMAQFNSAPRDGWGGTSSSLSSSALSSSSLGSGGSSNNNHNTTAQFGLAGLGFGLGSSFSSSASLSNNSSSLAAASLDPFADPVLHPSSSSSSSSNEWPKWEVSVQTKATADEFFVLLDESGRGSIDLETARVHLTQPGITAGDLSKIWQLADINKDSRLSQDEFAVVLHLIERTKLGHAIPRTLSNSLVPPALRPPGSNTQTNQTLEDVLIDLRDIQITPNSNSNSNLTSRHHPSPSLPSISEQDPHLLGPSGTLLAAQRHSQPPPTRRTTSTSSSPSPHLHARSVSVPAVPRQPVPPTSGSASPQPPPPVPPATPADLRQEAEWDVTPVEKARSDKFFDTLDPWKQGIIDGDAAVPFLSKSKLPDSVLAHIWDLADRDGDGKLSKEDFAVAMYLIRTKMEGKVLPETLPDSLVPPSQRPGGSSKPLPPAPTTNDEHDLEAEEIFAPAPAPTTVPARTVSLSASSSSTGTGTLSRNRTRGPRPAPTSTRTASPEPPPPPPHDLPPDLDDELRSSTPPPPYTETEDGELL